MTGRTLPEFPTDDAMLALLEEALDTTVYVGNDGNRQATGVTLSRLLEFASGYDPSRSIEREPIAGTPTYELMDQLYSESDVIRALIKQVRMLRNTPRAEDDQ